MGQYYVIANMDKREFISPYDFDSGSKLMEWSYYGNSFSTAMLKLMNTSWKGDRVFVIGDYAEDYLDIPDYDIPYRQVLSDLREEFHLEGKKLLDDYGNETKYDLSLYNYIYDEFTRVYDAPKGDRTPRYVYNHKDKQYIDFTHAPIAFCCGTAEDIDNTSCVQIFPLSILLAMGNGLSGSDYSSREFSETEQFAGSWCDKYPGIEVSTHKLKECKSYEEYQPNFAEDDLIPYTMKADCVAAVKGYFEQFPGANYVNIYTLNDINQYK